MSETLTAAERIEAIKDRLRCVSKGPWTNICKRSGERMLRVFSPGQGFAITSRSNGNEVCSFKHGFDRWGNSEFIAHSKADVEWLLERVEALEKQLGTALPYVDED